MTDQFAAAWDTFNRELNTRNQRLRKEIEASWNSLDSILQKHAEKFTPENWDNLPKNTLSAILEAIHTQGSVLLFEPLLSLRKVRSQERALSAIGEYPTDIEDALRLLPQKLMITRADLAICLSRKGRLIDRSIPGFGKHPRAFHIRDAARAVLQRHLSDRIKWDGRMVLLLAQASLALLIPWELFRNEALNSAMNTQYRIRDLSPDRDAWLQRISNLKDKAERILAAYDELEKCLPERLAGTVLSDHKSLSAKRLTGARHRRQQFFSSWSAQQRAVVAELELEFSSGKLLETAVGISSESLVSIDKEHIQIMAELDTVRNWLGAWGAEKKMDPFPPPEARLMASEERATAWNRSVAAAARAVMPVHVELMDTEHILPGRPPSRRSLEPQDCLLESLTEVGRGIALIGFREAEEGHQAVIREIERAREVTAYSMEGDIEETGSDPQVAIEGIQNAVSLLDHQKESITDFHPVVEHRLTEALAASFYQFYLSIDESKLGFYKYLVRQKGSRVFHVGALSVYEKIKTGLRLVRDKFAVLRDRGLVSMGWAPPSTSTIEPVVRREYLGELLKLKVVPRELPALYKRLFRLVPLEDPRFLIGRDAEIGAMAQARRQWEEGRSVSVLVAGARGSGKTSLLNCAHMAVFNDLSVTRGQFSQRITTPAELHSFLCSLFHSDMDGLRPFLGSGKRVVMLEEVERTFIRDIGGVKALRALLSLIAATSKNTLWILSLNQVALNFLENVISFEENFSHRINAMAVAPDQLTDAILVRHNLSGLRLQLTPPKSDNSRFDAVRSLLGLVKDTKQSYFEFLYRQSEGIFRSAFELWLQSVDRVEGGVLHMLSPAEPEYGKMISQLTLDDAFKLQAILQHGGLTAEEVAQIFDEPIEKSDRCMDKLIAWDVLEADPNGPGFRVRPAAGRFVRNALYRQNLL